MPTPNMPKINSRHPARLLWRILLPCLALLWCVFIFANSAASGTASQSASHSVASWVLNQPNLAQGTSFEAVLRKLGHLAEYTLLGLLLAATLRAYTPQLLRSLAWPLLAGLLVATLDETLQLHIPGRSGLPSDVLLDFGGLLLGTGLFLLSTCIIRGIRTRRAKKGAR